MPRAARRYQLSQTACYHVMNRGHNRETLFRDDDDFRYFLALLARYRSRTDFQLFHYCLMSNHFHLLLQPNRSNDLSPLMAGMLRAYVHYFNRRYGFVGHLFQGRFKAKAVEAETYLLSCGRYIERNPIEAGLVADPWAYPWSSCRVYAVGEADPLLTLNPRYEELSPAVARRQARWREFLCGDDPKEAEIRRHEGEDWAVGTPGYRARMQREEARPAPRRRGRPRQMRSPQEVAP